MYKDLKSCLSRYLKLIEAMAHAEKSELNDLSIAEDELKEELRGLLND